MTSLYSWSARVVDGRMTPTTVAPFHERGDIQHDQGGAHALAELEKTSGVRAKLYELQAAIADELPPVDCPLQHSFIDGVYVRTIKIPAGTVIVGKIHKHSHANILSQGRVTMRTEDGGKETIEGPMTMVSPAGCKRAIYCHTDTVWTTIHATEETDLEKIERYVIAQSYEEYEQFKLEDEAMKQIEVTR